MLKTFLCAIGCAVLVSCAPSAPQPPTRDQVIATARSYTRVEWLPDERHVRHGPDGAGILVRTPDHTLSGQGAAGRWWQPGVPATGMPYKWGGFDTPETFLAGIAAGQKAGDIATPAKRRADDAGTSRESVGIDCSGFVSRCWGLDRPYSTRELPEICDRLASWDDLKPGDILLNDRHVVLFAAWYDPARKDLVAYEAGPHPVWKASANRIPIADLRRWGYSPWRYRHINESPASQSGRREAAARPF